MKEINQDTTKIERIEFRSASDITLDKLDSLMLRIQKLDSLQTIKK